MKIAVCAAAFLLAGCTVGPDYTKPDLATPASYGDLPTAKAEAPLSLPVANEQDLTQWWSQFRDPELDSLIVRAMGANLDLMTAVSRVREAREQEIEAGAAGLPQVNASALAAHVHSNSNPLGAFAGGGASSSSGGSGASTAMKGTDLKLYSLGFDATWEIDIFGGVRRSVEAAQANTESAEWQMRDGEVTLTAEIATNYLSLRALQEQIAILQDQQKHQRDTLGLVRARAKAGFVTQLDVNQQVSLTQSTAAQIPELEAQAGAAEHAIAVLLAEPPGAVAAELERTAPLPAIPDTISVGLPSDLLRRRPDVREAERKLAAATAQVGVAVADLYPKFDLIGAASLASNHFSSLFTGNSLGEIGAGSIMWPIFHGGEIRANIRAKTDEADQAYYAYKKTVLGAIQDAEDALLRYTKEQQRYAALRQAVVSGRSSVDIAGLQYRTGLVTYVNVLTAQSNDLAAENQLEQSKQALAADLVSLYKALGGGWSAAEIEPPAKPA